MSQACTNAGISRAGCCPVKTIIAAAPARSARASRGLDLRRFAADDQHARLRDACGRAAPRASISRSSALIRLERAGVEHERRRPAECSSVARISAGVSDGGILDVAAHDVLDEQRRLADTHLLDRVLQFLADGDDDVRAVDHLVFGPVEDAAAARDDRLYLKLLSCCGRLECMS